MLDTSSEARKIIAEHIDVDLSKVVGTSTLKSLGCDSLDAVQFLMKLEEAFGITIPDEEAEKLSTVNDLVKLIDRQRGTT